VHRWRRGPDTATYEDPASAPALGCTRRPSGSQAQTPGLHPPHRHGGVHRHAGQVSTVAEATRPAAALPHAQCPAPPHHIPCSASFVSRPLATCTSFLGRRSDTHNRLGHVLCRARAMATSNCSAVQACRNWTCAAQGISINRGEWIATKEYCKTEGGTLRRLPRARLLGQPCPQPRNSPWS
jgi:hypothetical protein